MSEHPVIRHVSDTAFLVAQHRALESARKDALFSDPLAAGLAGERGRAIVQKMPSSRMTGWMVAIRTRIIDDFITEAVARGVDTVVNLGAGMDTRPYRLALSPALRWVEVDYPDLIAWKEQRLGGEASRCRLERIGLDLARLPERRALLARLDGEAGRILILTEGVIPCLDLEAAGALADDLRGLAHVDSWIVDYISPRSLAWRERRGLDKHMSQAPFRFRPPDWFGFFAAHGWSRREIRYLPVEGKRLGRRAPLPIGLRLALKVLRAFAPRDRRSGFDRFSGYAVLEPAVPSARAP
jgi:methyltransferase (TIGR00027 family)